jgi:hypothetical protein
MKIPPNKLTKEQMINMGATGVLSTGYLRYIPVDKISGLDPAPKDWVNDEGEVKKYVKGGEIKKPIEVIYDKEDDCYYLQDGNHRIQQTLINGDEYILAFIQPDRGQIGEYARTFLSSLREFVERVKLIIES